MKVTINLERNDRISLRESKELIQQVLYGKGSTGMEPSKEILDPLSILHLGW